VWAVRFIAFMSRFRSGNASAGHAGPPAIGASIANTKETKRREIHVDAALAPTR